MWYVVDATQGYLQILQYQRYHKFDSPSNRFRPLLYPNSLRTLLGGLILRSAV